MTTIQGGVGSQPQVANTTTAVVQQVPDIKLSIKDTIKFTFHGNGQATKIIQGNAKQGIVRALKMTFLRPTGWAQMMLHFTTLGITALIFPVKHFLEGYIGANSMWLKRTFLDWNPLAKAAQREDGRTLVQAFKQLIDNFKNRKALAAAAQEAAKIAKETAKKVAPETAKTAEQAVVDAAAQAAEEAKLAVANKLPVAQA